MKKSPQHIASLLGAKNPKSRALFAEAKRISQINLIVNQLLDHSIAEHVYTASTTDGLLTLVVDSPVWATRLRYIQKEIINGLQKFTISKYINRISIKVRPLELIPKPAKRPPRKMTISSASASRMQQELEAISDPNLVETLKRILRHAK